MRGSKIAEIVNYMHDISLAIPFLFAESVFGRIFNNFVPGLIVDGVEDIPLIYWGFHLSEILAITIALYLYFCERRFGHPFLVVSIAMALQSIAFESLDQVSWWREIFLATANVPVLVVAFAGIGIGAFLSWLGWTAPNQRRVRRVPRMATE